MSQKKQATKLNEKDQQKANALIKSSEKIRKQFYLTDNEDVIQVYRVSYKNSTLGTRGKLYITQNHFCYKSSFGKKFYIKSLISDVTEVTPDITIHEKSGKTYTYVPQSSATEAFNLMNYLKKYPFSVIDLNIYKQHTIESNSSGASGKFDIRTAEDAYNGAVELKKIKEENKRMLQEQQRRIELIDDMLTETDQVLGEIDDGLKATQSFIYELKLRYTKTTITPKPILDTSVLFSQVKSEPPRKVDVQILWKLESDELIPAIMSIYDQKIEVNEENENKKKLMSRSFAISDINSIFLRARPIHINLSLNFPGKEKGRLRLAATCSQFIVNEIYIRYMQIMNGSLEIVFEPNSRIFDYGDLTITKTFMNCGPVKSMIKFEEETDFALRDYLRMRKLNEKTVDILGDVTALNNETTQLASDSVFRIEEVTERMNTQKGMMADYKKDNGKYYLNIF
ncbi:GRAM domain-containing protein [Entamoeba marina]